MALEEIQPAIRTPAAGAANPAVGTIIGSRYTIIVPARNAERTLHRCLAALHQSDVSGTVEVLVVHDGGIPQPNRAGVRGLLSPESNSAAAARNHGAAEIREGVIVFVDSDVLLDRTALQCLVEPIRSGNADATVGNYSRDVRGLSFLEAFKQLYVATVYSRKRGYIENEFWTAIGAIRAEAFHRLGGFDPTFKGACGEDTDLGRRLTAAGFRVLAVPEATGQHLHEFTLLRLLLNDFRKGRRTMLNALIHRNLVSGNRHSTPSDILSVLSAGAIFLPVLATPVLSLVPILILFVLFLLAWILARRDIFAVYCSRGRLFMLRAILMVLLLDWVRGCCVLAALAEWTYAGAIRRVARR